MEAQTTIHTVELQQQTPVNFNIDLTTIPYQDSYRLRSGSAAQLVRGVQSMLTRVSADKETDEYKKALYPKLREVSVSLVTKFTSMLQATTMKEQEVRKYNLCGYEGQVKPDKYGRYPFVKGVNPNTKYAFANFGYFIKMLRQRMEFIMSREVPQRYVTDDEQRNTFTTLRTEVTSFLEHLNTVVEPQWNTTVQNARTIGGDAVKQNLEQRVKAQTERKQNYDKNKQKPKQAECVETCEKQQCKPEECKTCGCNKAPNKRFAMPKWVKKN